jgi:predicted acetyltransferase
VELVKPSVVELPSYREAVVRGWSPSEDREGDARIMSQLDADPDAFVSSLEDREARGAPIVLPDGNTVARLPSVERWLWDGVFCGRIQLRWQPGTTELPPTCLGHIGYMVVPWRRRLGYATAALAQLLPLGREVGLPWVELVTDLGNLASQRVILANGGERIEQFSKPQVVGVGEAVRFRIHL